MRPGCNSIATIGLILAMAMPAYLNAQGNGSGNAALTQRVEALEAAVVQLQAALNAEIAALQLAVNAEIAARQAADAALQQNINTEAAGRAAADTILQTNIDNAVPPALLDLANYVSVNLSTIKELSGPHIIFTGANIHIRSGRVPALTYGTNGVGNVVIGYNGTVISPDEPPIASGERSGSHNLIIGDGHRYPSAGGFLAGFGNTVTAGAGSVSGGVLNTASGVASSVSGGAVNTASGGHSSVSGGVSNTASGVQSSVSGGDTNTASGSRSSVSGGADRTAAGATNWTAGSLAEPQ